MSQSKLSLFHPLIQTWFAEKLGKPTDIQNLAWPHIAQAEHVLISAPTGSGKTLTAFLWAINQLVTGELPGGRLRILYISPSKALNNDVQRNLLTPLSELESYFKNSGETFPEIRVFTRSGDTPQNERQKMIRRPPEILITTPETLNILLTSKNNRTVLSGISTVILDEIHAIVGNKRGTHLITAVDRLIPLCGEFQRIALSATVKPMEKIAEFVGGYRQAGNSPDGHYEKRPVTLIRSLEAKQYQVKVCAPFSQNKKHDSIWPALTKACKKIIHQNRATLLFTNSRRTAEKVTRLINETEPEVLAYSHHGSLSKEIRLVVEQKLKQGELKAIVATNSLELGIDIGELDQVILVQSPKSISSAIQRVGRSGHRVGEISNGLLCPTHPRDFLDSAILARSIIDQDIEAVHPVESPLDVLAQIILSMTVVEQWDIDKLYAFLKTSYPFHTLSRRQYDLLLEMLAGRYSDSRMRELKPRVSLDRIDNTVKAKDGVSFLLFMTGGTIPDRGYFDLRLQESHAKIGELDEEFVWERSVGETFTLGTQLWKIQRITHNDVEVVPSSNVLNIIPFWKAEEQTRGFYFSEKVAIFLEEADSCLETADFKKRLVKDYFMEPAAANELIEFLLKQRKVTESSLPHRHHILIEHFDDPANKADSKQVLLHTLWGGKINKPFSLALAAAWEKRYQYPLQTMANDDSVLLMLPHRFHIQDIFDFVSSDNLETLLRKKLEQTGFFGARFRENASRALLLPKANFKKRMPLWLNRLRSKKLMEAAMKYEDFPILLETWRTCFQDQFDIAQLKMLLEEIQDGRITITQTNTKTPSPFSGNIIWRQTNKHMYEDDTPEFSKQSSLHEELIKELIASPSLRPLLPKELIETLNGKLKRTAPGYPPSSGQDLLDWIKERLLIPENEWKELRKAIKRDYKTDPDNILEENAEKIVWLRLPNTPVHFLCAIEILPRITTSFQIERQTLTIMPLVSEKASVIQATIEKVYQQIPRTGEAEEENTCSICDFFSQWFSYYGPIEKQKVARLFGLSMDLFDETIEPLIDSQTIVIDKFSQESKREELCDRENLEILLRLARKQRQPAFKALALENLPLFLASYQGVATRGESMEDLQQTMEQLFGYPAPAQAWEEYILPARMQPYYTAWLDSLMQSSDLLWFGSAKKKISFCFPQDLELFQEHRVFETIKDIEKIFPDKRGRYNLLDLTTHSGLDSSTLTKKLWELAWSGNVTNDAFASIRKGIQNKFTPSSTEGRKPVSRRSYYNRWKSTRPLVGNWYILENRTEAEDLLEETELIKDRIRQLLKRYGILFRELLVNESPLLQWRAIFRTLRLMELSGEILTGHFFEGVPELQFISHESYRFLQKQLPEDSVYWLYATDPASLCGVKLKGLNLPARIPSTIVVYHGNRIVIIAKRNGRILEIKAEPDHPDLQRYFQFFKELLSREFNPLGKSTIENINGESVINSIYTKPLKEFGFHASYNCLDLWKSY